MTLKQLPWKLSVCRLKSMQDVPEGIFFLSRTDEEISLVCEAAAVPKKTEAREDGWRGFRIEGQLDFSLIGILSGISAVLAAEKIGIFAVSTFNTDYILVKEADFAHAMEALQRAGYEIC